MSKNIGKVSQIIGPVVDVIFEDNSNELPHIYDSLEITRDNGSKLILECQQHIGEDTVRSISMETTDQQFNLLIERIRKIEKHQKSHQLHK